MYIRGWKEDKLLSKILICFHTCDTLAVGKWSSSIDILSVSRSDFTWSSVINYSETPRGNACVCNVCMVLTPPTISDRPIIVRKRKNDWFLLICFVLFFLYGGRGKDKFFVECKVVRFAR